MPKIYFLCGFIGSGKTTYAKRLAKEQSAYRYSIDEWMIPLYGEHMEREIFDARISTLTKLFQESAVQLLALNVSVIFDFGYWDKQDREEAAAWANKINADYEIIYLDVDFETCSERALARNIGRDEQTFEMTPEMLQLFWSKFEVPSSDENITRV